jgi:hypothetical protein
VHHRALIAGDVGELGDRLQHPGFVLRVHHGHQRSRRIDCRSSLLYARSPLAVDPDSRDAPTMTLEPGARLRRSRVLDHRRDDSTAIFARTPRIARLLASVPPDVKMISLASHPISPANCWRARSTADWERCP